MEINRQLVIDIGNTRCKVALFHNHSIESQWVFDSDLPQHIMDIIREYSPEASILSTVGKQADELKELLANHTRFVELTHQLKFPFVNGYQTPQTLGMDRVAGVAGALHFYEKAGCLVIDLGTCVTYDFITKEHVYMGGAISPGLRMRLDAMAHFTQRLPKLVFEYPDSFVGTTTQTGMLSGAYYGLLGEINETIARYEEQFGTIQVLICGGDTALFDKHIKKSIFAAPDLVLYGLNKLLTYNAT